MFLRTIPSDWTEYEVKTPNYYRRIKLRASAKTVKAKFAFNRYIIDEIKTFEGARWEPDTKIWSFPITHCNEFKIQFLLRGTPSPYAPYDADIPEVVTSNRPLREYQYLMANFIVSRPGTICAFEMGLGKTLAWIEACEYLISKGLIGNEESDIWYVGPKSGVKAVSRDLVKWKALFRPRMITYEALVKIVETWRDGDPAPQMLCLDESSRIKTHTAKRSQAARAVADAMRDDHPFHRITLLSGTPSPKSPLDWWHQCMVAQPGFLREGKLNKFRDRLALIQTADAAAGHSFPKLVTWFDDPEKCKNCGQYREAAIHKYDTYTEEYCEFAESKNEIETLYRRMKGLVLVRFKKDCTDLPDKIFEVVHIKPDPEVLRTAALIRKRATRAIEALTLLRELSDGFQYGEEEIGETTCEDCLGKGRIVFNEVDMLCDACGGSGKVKEYKRTTTQVKCPKDDELINDLDALDEIGRITVWGGFTATIDRIVAICQKQGWCVLRVDGRGYIGYSFNGDQINADTLLSAMDRSSPDFESLRQTYPRVAFVGHPQAAGMALTLTASPVEIFFSNVFNGEARFQAVDRGHRLGMDENRGLTIKDYIHLPSDKLVLDNLEKKNRLQKITLGEIQEYERMF